MNRKRTLIAILTALCALGLAPSALAEATRTWVSGVGDDANPCSRTAPCKTFAGAISKTAAGGEINALDPGGFGAITITKSITIRGTGTMAGILAGLGQSGIIVNGANVVVKLKNLSINGISQGTIGVRILNAKSVRMDDVEIYGFTNRGISWENTAAGRLHVNRSEIYNNTARGIFFQPAAAGGKLTVVDSALTDNGGGVGVTAATGPAMALLRDVTVAGNSNPGIIAENGARVTIESSTIMDNGTGISANTGSVVRVSNSSISYNTLGLSASGGSLLLSRLNNTFDDNVTQGAFTGSYGPQ